MNGGGQVKSLNPILLSGKEVLPLIEGGKGISITNGQSSGAWAAAGGVGTFSCVNADAHDEQGRLIPLVYKGTTRRERHEELIKYAIKGGITQARIAHQVAGGQGRIHLNVLWEMGGTERVLEGVLSQVADLLHGITCGAGMPFKLAEISARYKLYYYPIVSSARAFSILWRRSYHRYQTNLGAVVYEDPWRAGGHNGLSNSEDPKKPEDPYPRVLAIRKAMNEVGLTHTPIIVAGGVWWLEEWEDWIDNKELGPIAFQFGTRPLLTKESPISDQWKQRLLTLKPGDIFLNRFSPTGFYSSAVNNEFLNELEERSKRQVAYTLEVLGAHTLPLPIGPRQRVVYLTEQDSIRAQEWLMKGYTQVLKTPDSTLLFVTPEKAQQIRIDQIECMGCLSRCGFSNWAQDENGTTGKRADPRSFCIQKTLQAISHGANVEHELMFSGHSAYRFGEDPFYAKGFIPTVKQLIERIQSGK